MTEPSNIEKNPYRFDLAQISAVANYLLAQRIGGYTEAVKAERMFQVEADRGIRIMTAVAQTFHAAAKVMAMPERKASRAEMHREMMLVAAKAAERADRMKADLFGRGQNERGIALCTQMMAHYLQPVTGDPNGSISMIEQNVSLTLEIRAEIYSAERKEAA
jgi:hypothetical protein